MRDKATFAAGCFWGVEEAFRSSGLVSKTVVGYTGGSSDFSPPSYEQVCTGKTGHAEAVQVDFDPQTISYPELLDIFWKCHDPTQFNRQGPDVGTQYRSAIFYHTEGQKLQAEDSKRVQAIHFKVPIVTAIEPFASFYPAEEYHQKYLQKNRMKFCHYSSWLAEFNSWNNSIFINNRPLLVKGSRFTEIKSYARNKKDLIIVPRQRTISCRWLGGWVRFRCQVLARFCRDWNDPRKLSY